ncbi:hypothetical protein ADUPG1_006608, partial [Aduncisulcus paluster]
MDKAGDIVSNFERLFDYYEQERSHQRSQVHARGDSTYKKHIPFDEDMAGFGMEAALIRGVPWMERALARTVERWNSIRHIIGDDETKSSSESVELHSTCSQDVIDKSCDELLSNTSQLSFILNQSQISKSELASLSSKSDYDQLFEKSSSILHDQSTFDSIDLLSLRSTYPDQSLPSTTAQSDLPSHLYNPQSLPHPLSLPLNLFSDPSFPLPNLSEGVAAQLCSDPRFESDPRHLTPSFKNKQHILSLISAPSDSYSQKDYILIWRFRYYISLHTPPQSLLLFLRSVPSWTKPAVVAEAKKVVSHWRRLPSISWLLELLGLEWMKKIGHGLNISTDRKDQKTAQGWNKTQNKDDVTTSARSIISTTSDSEQPQPASTLPSSSSASSSSSSSSSSTPSTRWVMYLVLFALEHCRDSELS